MVDYCYFWPEKNNRNPPIFNRRKKGIMNVRFNLKLILTLKQFVIYIVITQTINLNTVFTLKMQQ